MTPSTRRRLLLTALFAPTLLRAQPLAGQYLPPLIDLRVLSESIARHQAPLLILFSTPGCPYCLEVRRNYLAPRAAEQASLQRPDLLLREVDITSERTLIDLSGATVTEQAFALMHGVRIVPVVALFDASLRRVGEPLVGLDRAGFYEGYLASAIEAGRKFLRQTS